MTAGHKFRMRALRASIEWDVPESVLPWLRDDLLREVLDGRSGSDPFEAIALHEVSWTHDERSWKASGIDGHVVGTSPLDLLPETMIAINSYAAASMADDHLVLHAGVFAAKNSQGQDLGIALCGSSGAGKSTATAAAALRGHPVVAEEVCAIDPHSNVIRRYARPIGVRAGGAAALGLVLGHPFTDSGAGSGLWRAPLYMTQDPVLGTIALLTRRPGRPTIELLRPAEALEALVHQTLASEGRHRTMFRRIDAIVRDTPVVRLSYEEAFDGVDALSEWVAQR